MAIEDAKRCVGIAAADLVLNGMIVGLGTGSTAAFFIEALAHRIKSGLFLKAVVASSDASSHLANRLGMRICDLNDVSHIDLTVDGADEIDPLKRMIKGGGGAHVREKILASCSHELVVIVDETKLVPSIGRGKLPIEVLRFGSSLTRAKILNLGFSGTWRLSKEGSRFITENENYLFDIAFETPPPHPERLHEELIHLPGVVDTGFFFNMAGRVIVGYQNGRTEIR